MFEMNTVAIRKNKKEDRRENATEYEKTEGSKGFVGITLLAKKRRRNLELLNRILRMMYLIDFCILLPMILGGGYSDW